MREGKGLGRTVVAILAAWLMCGTSALASTNSSPRPDVSSDPQVRMLIESSQRAFAKGQLEVAIIEAKHAVRVAPLSGLARAQLGICLMQAGDALNAEDQLRQARYHHAPDALVLPSLFEAMLIRDEDEEILDEFPDPGTDKSNAAIILRARAFAFQAVGEPAKASASMGRSIAILRDTKGLVAAGGLALQQVDLARARELTDEALRQRPNDPESLDLSVHIALAMHDKKLALATANRLVALTPKSLNSRLTRIEVYFALNMDDQARGEIALADQEFSNSAIVEYYRALYIARSGRIADAWKVAMVLPFAFNKSDLTIAKNVAQIAAESGHLEPAAAILKDAIDKWPRDQDARIRLAAIRLAQKNPADALNVLLPLEDTTDSRVAMLFARVYAALHRPDDARRYLAIINANGGVSYTMTMELKDAAALFARLLQNNPNDVETRGKYAQILSKLGDQEGAKSQYEIILRASPDDVTALNNLSWLIQKSDPHRALSMATLAAKLSPKSASVLDTDGWLAYGQNDTQTALGALERAHTLNPNSPTISYHLAEVLKSLGRVAEAKALLQSALENGGDRFQFRADAEKLRGSLH